MGITKMARIYYRWKDADGEEQVTRNPPGKIRSLFGGEYVPDYEQVVVIPVAQDNE